MPCYFWDSRIYSIDRGPEALHRHYLVDSITRTYGRLASLEPSLIDAVHRLLGLHRSKLADAVRTNKLLENHSPRRSEILRLLEPIPDHGGLLIDITIHPPEWNHLRFQDIDFVLDLISILHHPLVRGQPAV